MTWRSSQIRPAPPGCADLGCLHRVRAGVQAVMSEETDTVRVWGQRGQLDRLFQIMPEPPGTSRGSDSASRLCRSTSGQHMP